jgi:hypothetical protein
MTVRENRCFGITRNLHRCGRSGDWRLFCPEHRRQPIAWLVFLVFTVVAGFSSIKSAWWPPSWRSSCTVEGTISADVLSRLYFRGSIDPELKEQTLSPTSQELFYEWQISLVASDTAHDVAFELHHLENDDRVSLRPSTAGTLSDPAPWWYSGFPEPQRQKPDHFVRKVALTVMASSPTSVLIRRALPEPTIAPNDLISIENATSAECSISLQAPSVSAEYLQARALRLSKNLYQSGGTDHIVPLEPDPGDVGPTEMQGTVEVRCNEQSCDTMVAGQLEARMGKSPRQLREEPQARKVESCETCEPFWMYRRTIARS